MTKSFPKALAFNRIEKKYKILRSVEEEWLLTAVQSMSQVAVYMTYNKKRFGSRTIRSRKITYTDNTTVRDTLVHYHIVEISIVKVVNTFSLLFSFLHTYRSCICIYMHALRTCHQFEMTRLKITVSYIITSIY